MRKESEVDEFSSVRGERRKTANDGEEDLKKGVQSMHCIVQAELAFESFPIEPDVPVGGIIDETKQSRHHSVKAVGCHFFIDKSQQTLTIGQNPPIEHVRVG